MKIWCVLGLTHRAVQPLFLAKACKEKTKLDLWAHYLASYVWLEPMQFLSGYVKQMLISQRHKEPQLRETLEKLAQAWCSQLDRSDFEGVAAATLKAAIETLQGE